MTQNYNSSNPVLIDSIVCFTDILGFSSIVTQAKNRQAGNQLLKNLHSILMDQYDVMKEMNPYGQFKTFTDNVILAYPKWSFGEEGEGASGSVFSSFIDYQLTMTLKGYFLRGGIAEGDYYGDADFAYGAALIEAHYLEDEEADFPRIILSEKMKDLVAIHLNYYGPKTESPQYSDLFKDDEDGYWFINYLEGLNEEYLNDQDINKYITKLLKHKDIITNRLNEFKGNQKLYDKYQWSAQYHNYFCDQYFYKNAIQQHGLKINNIPPGKFSRIVVNNMINK